MYDGSELLENAMAVVSGSVNPKQKTELMNSLLDCISCLDGLYH